MNDEDVSVDGSIAPEKVAVAEALAVTEPAPATGVTAVTTGGGGSVAATSNVHTNGASSDAACCVRTVVPRRAVYEPESASGCVGVSVARSSVPS